MPIKDHIPATLIGDLRVWRAAMAVDPADQRPTGAPQPPGAARRHQEAFDAQLIAQTPTYGVVQLRHLGQGLDHDPITPLLARDLEQLEVRRLPVGELLTNALDQGPLPAELPAAALRWRIKQLAKDQPDKDRDGERWKQWAATVNPDLTTSPHWPTIQGLLTNLQDRIHPDKLAEAWKDKTPQEIRAALFLLRSPRRETKPPRSRVGDQDRRRYVAATRPPVPGRGPLEQKMPIFRPVQESRWQTAGGCTPQGAQSEPTANVEAWNDDVSSSV